jgi:hypothetical protein
MHQNKLVNFRYSPNGINWNIKGGAVTHLSIKRLIVETLIIFWRVYFLKLLINFNRKGTE